MKILFDYYALAFDLSYKANSIRRYISIYVSSIRPINQLSLEVHAKY